jgi:Predicted membrane protein
MTLELHVLGWATLLAVVQLLLYAVPANREIGSDYLAGPRDEGVRLKGVRTGRLQRAFNNHIEGLVLFAAATVVVVAGGKASGFTHACALAYLAARVAYVPAYAYGLTPWRSVVWAVGFFATILMLLAALLF